MSKHLVALAALLVTLPVANAEGLLPVDPIINGDFELDVSPGGVGILYPFLNTCVGAGHQVLNPLYSSWGDWVFDTANTVSADPSSAVAVVTDPGFVGDATGYPANYAGQHVTDPLLAVRCDPKYNDAAQLNAWNTLNDPGFMWSNDPGTTYGDVNGDGDREAVIPRVPTSHNHNMWQSYASMTQLFSADFDSFDFTLESGMIPAGANVQIGLSLTPGYTQSPWVGIFWEGAVLFRANDMVAGPAGAISMDPVAKGEIICPGGYTPCLEFKAAYDQAQDEAAKRTLLGGTRIVQTSFWSFSGGVGPVVLDNVSIVGSKSAVETLPNPNPSA